MLTKQIEKRVTFYLVVLAGLLFIPNFVPAQKSIIISSECVEGLEKVKNSSNTGDELLKSSGNASANTLSHVGRWTEGPCRAVDADDNYVFSGNGINLMIADYSDPANLNVISQVQLDESCIDIIVAGDYVYTVTNSKLYVVNISEISDPVISGTCDLDSSPADFQISGEYLFVGTSDGLEIIDVSNPSGPVSIALYSEYNIYSNELSVMSVCVNDSCAFIGWAPSGYGISIVDISNPSDPTLLKNISSDKSKAHDMYLSGNCLYAAHCSDGLVIYDISNPDSTFITAEYATGHAQEITGSGNEVYIYHFNEDINGHSYDIAAFDVSDPYNPVPVGGVDGSVYKMKINGDYLFIADGELSIVDINDPANPVIAGEHDFAGNSRIVVAHNDVLYVRCTDGIRIFDMTIPSGPVLSNLIDELYPLKKSGEMLYGFSGTGIVEFLDISDPYNPQSTGTINTGFEITGFEIKGNYIYLAGDTTVFSIYDISDPSSPVEEGKLYYNNHYFYSIDISGNYAYLLGSFYNSVTDTSTAVMKIIDISVPSNPVEITNFETTPGVHGYNKICIDGETVYLLHSNALYMVDISDKDNPEISGSLEFNDTSDMKVWNSYVYVTSSSDDLTVYDMSDKTDPFLVGNYQTSYAPVSVDVDDDYIYLAYSSAGFQILKNEIITEVEPDHIIASVAFSLENNYPNPFNPETIISYSIPIPSNVTLKIYNIKGQLIRTLASGQYPSGEHAATWDGKNDRGQRVGSGVYIYRLQAGHFTQTKKMLLIK